jgi:Integrase core domain
MWRSALAAQRRRRHIVTEPHASAGGATRRSPKPASHRPWVLSAPRWTMPWSRRSGPACRSSCSTAEDGKTRLELATSIHDYIAIWHNTERRHSALNMLTPSEYENQHLVQHTGRYGKADPTKPIGPHGLHTWWYRRLTAAGNRAGGHNQRRADAQGPTHRRTARSRRHRQPKAVEKLLGYTSIQTTGDIYADWDVDQLVGTMAEVLDDSSPTDNEPTTKLFPLSPENPCKTPLYRQRDSNPCYRRERAAS